MGAMVKNFKAEFKPVSMAFYSNDEFCEILIDQNGDCEYILLEEYLSGTIKNYRIDMLSDDALQSIACKLYKALKSANPKKNLDKVMNTIEPIITNIQKTSALISNAKAMLEKNECELQKIAA